eukprot:gene15282-biopygen10525
MGAENAAWAQEVQHWCRKCNMGAEGAAWAQKVHHWCKDWPRHIAATSKGGDSGRASLASAGRAAAPGEHRFTSPPSYCAVGVQTLQPSRHQLRFRGKKTEANETPPRGKDKPGPRRLPAARRRPQRRPGARRLQRTRDSQAGGERGHTRIPRRAAGHGHSAAAGAHGRPRPPTPLRDG